MLRSWESGRPMPYRIFVPYFEAYDLSAGGLADQSPRVGGQFLALRSSKRRSRPSRGGLER